MHPAEISPDGTKLVVCNLPDNHVEIFDITSGKPRPIGSLPVGLDPVTARFRTASELWVANFISDSISIIDLPSMRVVSTITTSNEPSDIVFAGAPQRAIRLRLIIARAAQIVLLAVVVVHECTAPDRARSFAPRLSE